MDRRVVTAGIIAALASPALAQQSTVVSPIPVQPQATETLSGGGLATQQGAQTQQDRQNRVQQGGSPADTTSARRQGQASDPAGGGQNAAQQARGETGSAEQVQAATSTSSRPWRPAPSRSRPPPSPGTRPRTRR